MKRSIALALLIGCGPSGPLAEYDLPPSNATPEPEPEAPPAAVVAREEPTPAVLSAAASTLLLGNWRRALHEDDAKRIQAAERAAAKAKGIEGIDLMKGVVAALDMRLEVTPKQLALVVGGKRNGGPWAVTREDGQRLELTWTTPEGEQGLELWFEADTHLKLYRAGDVNALVFVRD
jgi:hypothetical protein